MGPLFALTKKEAEFKWKDTCEQAFDRLKDILTSAPLLVFPDFSKWFVLETDASGLELCAILSKEKSYRLIAPTAYASHTLQQHEVTMEYQSLRYWQLCEQLNIEYTCMVIHVTSIPIMKLQKPTQFTTPLWKARKVEDATAGVERCLYTNDLEKSIRMQTHCH